MMKKSLWITRKQGPPVEVIESEQGLFQRYDSKCDFRFTGSCLAYGTSSELVWRLISSRAIQSPDKKSSTPRIAYLFLSPWVRPGENRQWSSTVTIHSDPSEIYKRLVSAYWSQSDEMITPLPSITQTE